MVNFNQISIRVAKVSCPDTPDRMIYRIINQLHPLPFQSLAGCINILNGKYEAHFILGVGFYRQVDCIERSIHQSLF